MDTRAGAGYAASWTTEGTSGEKTVTEAEWLACDDPDRMLDSQRGKVSDRKLRLFACASCRHLCWPWLTDETSRHAVEVAERFTDGQVSTEELSAARSAAENIARQFNEFESEVARWSEVYDPALTLDSNATRIAAATAAVNAIDAVQAARRISGTERTGQASLLRELLGNPFRPPPTIDPAWLTWNHGTVVRLAQSAYEERQLPAGTLDNARLAVLADALEEAGCTNQDILYHCRSGGEHVRGCWVVDALLGKK
jgi:hypothetical protein